MRRIHERANADSLGLLRIIVFSVWAIIPIWEHVTLLAQLPTSAFALPGVLGFMPASLRDVLLTQHALWVLTIAMTGACLSVAIGVYPSRWITAPTIALIVLYEAVVRGFSGHINHAELALLYTTVALVAFPLYDGLSLRQAADANSRPKAQYRAAFLVAMIVFTLSFAFVGAARLSEGLAIFKGNTLRNLMIGRYASSIEALSELSLAIPLYARPELVLVPRLAYGLTTLAEIASPFALIHRSTRLMFVAFALVFHAINLLWLGVTFYENIVLLVVFSERWFHSLAAALAARWRPVQPSLAS